MAKRMRIPLFFAVVWRAWGTDFIDINQPAVDAVGLERLEGDGLRLGRPAVPDLNNRPHAPDDDEAGLLVALRAKAADIPDLWLPRHARGPSVD